MHLPQGVVIGALASGAFVRPQGLLWGYRERPELHAQVYQSTTISTPRPTITGSTLWQQSAPKEVDVDSNHIEFGSGDYWNNESSGNSSDQSAETSSYAEAETGDNSCLWRWTWHWTKPNSEENSQPKSSHPVSGPWSVHHPESAWKTASSTEQELPGQPNIPFPTAVAAFELQLSCFLSRTDLPCPLAVAQFAASQYLHARPTHVPLPTTSIRSIISSVINNDPKFGHTSTTRQSDHNSGILGGWSSRFLSTVPSAEFTDSIDWSS